MPELTATLIVSTTHSYCGHCRKNTLLRDGQGAPVTHHVDVCGYSPKPGGGCGARFVDISTDCWGVSPERLREIRPDLPVQGHAEDPTHS